MERLLINSMDHKETSDILVLRTREALVSEMLLEKTAQLSVALDNLKRFEGYSQGAKDIVEKASDQMKAQKLELQSLVSQQKLHLEVAALIELALDNTRNTLRVTSSDFEKLFFSKQGEIVYLKQEIERLNVLKQTCELQAETAELELKKDESESKTAVVVDDNTSKPEIEKSDLVVKKRRTKSRVRPDKDPKTRIGRAAIDVTERKKKYKTSSAQ